MFAWFGWFCNRMSDVREQTRCRDHLSIVVRGQTDGIFDWLDINLEKEPMSIVMCGYVDSGKSTTTGCILFELDDIPEQDEERFEKSFLVYNLLYDEAEGGVEARSEHHLQHERVLHRQVALHHHTLGRR